MSTLAERESAPSVNSAAPELSALRILVVHHWIYTWAGGERCLEQLLRLVPHADVLVGVIRPEMRVRNAIARGARESWVGRIPGARRHHRWFLPLHALAFSRFDTTQYDLVISISHAFEKAVQTRKAGAVHVSYCLTPPRYLWDLNREHARMASTVQRAALRLSTAPLRAIDRAAALGVHRFVSLSRMVADRVRRVYGRESAVVYPPVEPKTPRKKAAGRDSFLLSLGRLVPYKRVDLAIQAAEKLGVRLVVAGDGPERSRLERLAGRNTEILGEVSEHEAGELLSRCAGFVFCAEEDFGIAPLEANAHGAPVIAFGKGGVLETLEDGRTGVFFGEQTGDAVSAAIQRCLGMSWSEAELVKNADRFKPENFREGFRRQLVESLETRS